MDLLDWVVFRNVLLIDYKEVFKMFTILRTIGYCYIDYKKLCNKSEKERWVQADNTKVILT